MVERQDWNSGFSQLGKHQARSHWDGESSHWRAVSWYQAHCWWPSSSSTVPPQIMGAAFSPLLPLSMSLTSSESWPDSQANIRSGATEASVSGCWALLVSITTWNPGVIV